MPESERTESQGFFEMLWDCDHCGTKGLLGKTQRHCPECGAKQNPDRRYFPAEGAATRVDGHIYEGSDRTCPACDAPMGAKAKSCANCGAAMDGSREVRGVAHAVVAAAPRRSRWKLVLLILAAVVGVIVLLWAVLFRTRTATVAVTAHAWTRTIAIEEYADLQEASWRDTMPAEARVSSCGPKERSRRQVADGESCHQEQIDKKDGTFERVQRCAPKYRSEPVLGDWCAYRITRWHAVDARTTSGTGVVAAWPTMDLPPPTAAAVLGARRQGPRTEVDTLVLGTSRCDVSDSIWRKYTDGQAAKVDVRARSGAIVCDSL